MFDFDYVQPICNDGIVVMNDFPFVNVPKSPDDLIETINLRGSSTTSTAITGNVDDNE